MAKYDLTFKDLDSIELGWVSDLVDMLIDFGEEEDRLFPWMRTDTLEQLLSYVNSHLHCEVYCEGDWEKGKRLPEVLKENISIGYLPDLKRLEATMANCLDVLRVGIKNQEDRQQKSPR